MSGIKPAQATLNELNGGLVMAELAEHIHRAIAATKEFGKDATVSLDITVGVMKANHGNLHMAPIVMAGEVTSKLPKAPPPQTVFFIDEDGNASRNQTREPELGLRIAEQPANANAQS